MGSLRLLTVTSLTMLLVSLTCQALTQPAYIPHEDPSKVEETMSPLWLLTWYGDVLTLMADRDYAGASRLLDAMSLIYLPERLRYIIERFNSLLNLLTVKFNETETLLAEASSLLEAYRLEEARAKIVEASISLGRANITLTELSMALEELSRRMGVHAAPAGSRVREAYERLRSLTSMLRDLWERYLTLLRSLVRRLTLITGELVEGLVAPVGNWTMPKPLRQTSLSLSLNQTEAWVGEVVEAYGNLTSEGEPLPGRRIMVLLGNSVVSISKTDEMGVFRAAVRVPYVYTQRQEVKAVYMPEGGDLGVYKPCESKPMILHVLFLRVRLEVEHPVKAYPGTYIHVQGLAVADGLPVERLRVKASLAGEETSSTTGLDGRFNLSLKIPAGLEAGVYRLTVESHPMGVYAPGRYVGAVKVAKARLSLTVKVPGFLMIPGTLPVSGRVESELRLEARPIIYISLAGVVNRTETSRDGLFNCSLRIDSLSLISGFYQLTVRAEPRKPWNAGAIYKASILVLNPANIALALAALAFTATLALKSIRYLKGRPIKPMSEKPVFEKPTLMETTPVAAAHVSEGGWASVLENYLACLNALAGSLGFKPEPSETLREFMLRVRPSLGGLSKLFEELTLITETALYSAAKPTSEAICRAEWLAVRIVEGLVEG